MSGLVVIPCLPVGRAEVAEARRALAGQGRGTVDDLTLTKHLWLARALPAVLDTLADISLLDVAFSSNGDFELSQERPVRGPLSLVAWRCDDELVVEVLVLNAAHLAVNAFDAAVARATFPFRLTTPEPDLIRDDDTTAEENVVRLQRFTFGAPGRPPSARATS
jgi:hypothetical protein